jgi:RimJ/RimL family protein N-acetyltransferase
LLRKLDFRFHTEYWYEHHLDTPVNVNRPDGVTVDLLTIDRLPELLSVWDLDLVEMKKRLEDGHVCFTPRVNGEIAGYHWLQLKGNHYIQPAGLTIVINPLEPMIYHGRVSEKFQSRGIGGCVYQTILQYALDNRLNKVLVYTAAGNIANQKSLAKAGFKLTRKYYAVKINDRFINLLIQRL